MLFSLKKIRHSPLFLYFYIFIFLSVSLFLLFYVFSFLILPAAAQLEPVEDIIKGAGKEAYGPGAVSLAESQGIDAMSTFIGRIIQFVLGIIGAVMVILILTGGIIWMTAGGNEEQVKKGRNILFNAIIGLIIVMLTYAIAYTVSFFVLKATYPSAYGPP